VPALLAGLRERDIKVGVLTAMIGVPFFLYLIVRERRSLGGGVA